MCGVVFFGAFVLPSQLSSYVKIRALFFTKKEEEQDFACSCCMKSSQSLCILFTVAHFYNHYCNVCMLVFFYKHTLPFSVLLRKLPLHICRHRLSRYFPDLSDPKRLNLTAVQECVQCIFSNAESSNFMISFSMLQDSFPHFLVFFCFFYLYVRPFVKDFKP